MNAPSKLTRIIELRRRVEQLREMELHRAMGALRENQSLQADEIAAHTDELIQGRTALASGDVEQWMLSQAGTELIRIRLLRHREAAIELDQKRETAAELYSESRMAREQIERVAETHGRRAETLDGKRTQAALDDRFLSRRSWMRTAEKRR